MVVWEQAPERKQTKREWVSLCSTRYPLKLTRSALTSNHPPNHPVVHPSLAGSATIYHSHAYLSINAPYISSSWSSHQQLFIPSIHLMLNLSLGQESTSYPDLFTHLLTSEMWPFSISPGHSPIIKVRKTSNVLLHHCPFGDCYNNLNTYQLHATDERQRASSTTAPHRVPPVQWATWRRIKKNSQMFTRLLKIQESSATPPGGPSGWLEAQV